MRYSSSYWFDDEESIENTPPIGNEKDFTGRPDGLQRKAYALNYSERLPWNGHGNSMESSAVDDVQNVESSTDKETESNGPLAPQIKENESLKSMTSLAEHEVSFYYISSFLCFFLSSYWLYSPALMANLTMLLI